MNWVYPNIDPVIFALGPLEVRWYSLAYIAGLLIGWWLMGRLNRKQPEVLSQTQLDDLLMWVLGGVVLGGRVGYVLFYNLPYFMEYPLEALKIWEGGMSFHGGMLGVILAVYWFCRRQGISFWQVIDMAAVVTPIGLFFGRLANFINGELFGRITDSAIGMVFPHGGELPRHPSQLYEAALEGICLFLILLLVASRVDYRRTSGLLSGVFLAGYGVSRFIVEFFREPDIQLGLVGGGVFSMGQLLSLPMILCGLVLIKIAIAKKVAVQQESSQ